MAGDLGVSGSPSDLPASIRSSCDLGPYRANNAGNFVPERACVNGRGSAWSALQGHLDIKIKRTCPQLKTRANGAVATRSAVYCPSLLRGAAGKLTSRNKPSTMLWNTPQGASRSLWLRTTSELPA